MCHLSLLHEKGYHNGSTSADAHLAVNEDLPSNTDALLDEFDTVWEMPHQVYRVKITNLYYFITEVFGEGWLHPLHHLQYMRYSIFLQDIFIFGCSHIS